MLPSASRLSRAGIGTSQQQLYRTILLSGSPSTSRLRSDNPLQSARFQSTDTDNFKIISAETSSSNSVVPKENNQNKSKANSWKLRKRLRRLTVQLEQSSSDSKAPKVQGTKKSAWKHPSRPKTDVVELKQRARERWSEQAAEAAKAAAIVAERERLRKNTATSRAERNASKIEMREQAIKEKQGDDSEGADNSESKGESKSFSQKSVSIGRSSSINQKSSIGRLEESMAASWEAVMKSIGVRNNSKEETDLDLAAEEISEPSEEQGEGRIEAKKIERDLPPHSVMEADDSDQKADNSFRRKGRSGSWQDQAMRAPYSRQPEASVTELISGHSIDAYRKVRPKVDLKNIKQISRGQYVPLDHIAILEDSKRLFWDEEGKWNTAVGGLLGADDVNVERVEPLREMRVAQLAHGLDRVLFNPGLHWLRDVRTGIYNFEPRLRDIYDVDLFDYSALPPYRTSSKDPELAELVLKLSKKYSGSTSSMTGLLSHIYFLLSAWKQPDLSGYSSGFAALPKSYSYGAKLPASIVLQRFEEEYQGKNVVRYAIDADKGKDGAGDTSNYVLMQLGKSVEKLLTSNMEEYEKHLRVNSHTLSPEAKEKPEAYHYATSGKLLMRSQLDCLDERLPRKSFDLKTRSVIAVRQDRANWVESSGYKIRHATGVFESFEREMWDMTRATMLKYFFQARIGNMDGILVAFHSTSTMFGFQYLPCEDMAKRLFSSVEMGEQAFKLSLGLLERLLDHVTDIKPDRSLRITFDTEPGENPKMLVFAQYADEADGGDMAEAEGEATTQTAAAAQEQDVQDQEQAATAQTDTDEQLQADGVLSSEQKDKMDRKKMEQALRDRSLLQLDVEVDRYLADDLIVGPVDFNIPSGYRINDAMEDEISRRKRLSLPLLNWSVEYSITPRNDLNIHSTQENLRKVIARREEVSPLIMPNMQALNEREKMRERELSKNESALQKYFEDRKSGVALGMPSPPGQKKAKAGTGAGAGAVQAAVEERESDAKTEGEQTREPVQRWKKKSVGVERLRELARLGQEDKDLEAMIDRMEIYERRGD
jgi:hypothetical protein